MCRRGRRGGSRCSARGRACWSSSWWSARWSASASRTSSCRSAQAPPRPSPGPEQPPAPRLQARHSAAPCLGIGVGPPTQLGLPAGPPSSHPADDLAQASRAGWRPPAGAQPGCSWDTDERPAQPDTHQLYLSGAHWIAQVGRARGRQRGMWGCSDDRPDRCAWRSTLLA